MMMIFYQAGQLQSRERVDLDQAELAEVSIENERIPITITQWEDANKMQRMKAVGDLRL